MNKTLFILITIFSFYNLANAQFDERFYFPYKEYDLVEEENEYEDLFFEIDSVKIHTLWLKPTQKPETTVLLFMGASGNASHYVPIIKPLVNVGYQVLVFEPRGYGLSTGTPKHLNVISDAQTVFDSLVSIKEIKDTKIVIYGASLGSQAATYITKNNQGKITALIIDGGMSSFTDIALTKTPEAQKGMVEKFATSPYSAKEDLKNIEGIPKLFIHSKEDKTVPFSQAELNYTNAQEPKEMWIYKGGHLQAMKIDETAFVNTITKFIDNLN